MTLTIRNSGVASLATRLAAITGESKTEVIRRALVERSQKFYHDCVRQQHRLEMRRLLGGIAPSDVSRKPRSIRLTRADVEELLGYGPD
jgi:antitoxin VapB